jgi:hypothetical protein
MALASIYSPRILPKTAGCQFALFAAGPALPFYWHFYAAAVGGPPLAYSILNNGCRFLESRFMKVFFSSGSPSVITIRLDAIHSTERSVVYILELINSSL